MKGYHYDYNNDDGNYKISALFFINMIIVYNVRLSFGPQIEGFNISINQLF